RERGLELSAVTDASEIATNGVEATVAGTRVRVGKLSFITAILDESQRPEPAALQPGHAAAYVAIGTAFAGPLILADPIRPEAPDIVRSLAAPVVHQAF